MKRVALTRHAGHRIAERLTNDAAWVAAQVRDAIENHRLTRRRPSWSIKGNRVYAQTDDVRYVRMTDDGVPALAIVVDTDDAVVVTTVLRKPYGAAASRAKVPRPRSRRRPRDPHDDDWGD